MNDLTCPNCDITLDEAGEYYPIVGEVVICENCDSSFLWEVSYENGELELEEF